MADEALDNFNKPQPTNDDELLPDKEKRNFNENDILGDFDRDEKGNVIVL
jgi:hypothetical protein